MPVEDKVRCHKKPEKHVLFCWRCSPAPHVKTGALLWQPSLSHPFDKLRAGSRKQRKDGPPAATRLPSIHIMGC